jgi:pyruvate dehydrogenase E1 component alpha subunit
MPLKNSIDVRPAAGAGTDTELLLALWRTMLRIRRAEEMIAGLVDSGEARCPCHLYIGQEAAAAGVCAALQSRDTVWSGHRAHGHFLAKGGSAEALFAEILGKTTGCSGGRGGSMHLAAPEAGILGTVPIVAGTVPLAAGAAFAARVRREPLVAVGFLGDGAVEEGNVHETLNLAGLFRLPLVLVCENNQHASHLHWSERRALDNLHQAGEFHGVPGLRLDGNDVRAVYDAARAAVERARCGGGPAWLECRTFRWRGHVGSGADLDVGVRRRGDLAAWQDRDPIRRAEQALAKDGVKDLAAERAAIEEDLMGALRAARAAKPARAGRLLAHVHREDHFPGKDSCAC